MYVCFVSRIYERKDVRIFLMFILVTVSIVENSLHPPPTAEDIIHRIFDSLGGRPYGMECLPLFMMNRNDNKRKITKY